MIVVIDTSLSSLIVWQLVWHFENKGHWLWIITYSRRAKSYYYEHVLTDWVFYRYFLGFLIHHQITYTYRFFWTFTRLLDHRSMKWSLYIFKAEWKHPGFFFHTNDWMKQPKISRRIARVNVIITGHSIHLFYLCRVQMWMLIIKLDYWR